MLEERAKLPVAQSHDDILAAIEHNPVTIIRGETGSGKTTQVGKVYFINIYFMYPNARNNEILHVANRAS